MPVAVQKPGFLPKIRLAKNNNNVIIIITTITNTELPFTLEED